MKPEASPVISSRLHHDYMQIRLRSSPRHDLVPVGWRVRHLRRILALTVLATAGLGCGISTGGEWPAGYAVVEGRITLRDGQPYEGGLFVTFADHGEDHRTSRAGWYRLALSPSFPAGVPDTAVVLRVRSAYGQQFLDSTRVQFVSSRPRQRTHRLDIQQP